MSWLALLIILHIFILITEANPDGAMLTRFRNTANYDVVLWWFTPYPKEPIRFFGHLKANGGMTSFTSYVNHRFFWARPKEENDESRRMKPFTITKDDILYLFEDERNPGDRNLIESSYEEINFLRNYYRTNNRHWLSTYPRPEPVIPYIVMEIADINTKWVDSNSYFWNCLSSTDRNKGRQVGRILGRKYDPCQDRNNGNRIKFEIEQKYKTNPLIFTISNFVNQVEADHIIEISKPNMKRSTTGNGVNKRIDPTRTCSNTWLAMNRSKIIETIYHRIGDVLGIAQYKMNVDATVDNGDGNPDGVASHMEVVHFDTGEHYSRHYDNAVNDQINLHFITFQVVLSTSDDFEGGQTQFPHAHEGNRKIGFELENIKYQATFWYNLLPDGNLDETSMYSHAKVEKGDQWLFHVSIWDPALPKGGDPRSPHKAIYSRHDEL